MVNYSVINYSIRGSVEVVLAAMEAKLETVDNTKAIYLSNIVKSGNEFVGVLIYAA